MTRSDFTKDFSGYPIPSIITSIAVKIFICNKDEGDFDILTPVGSSILFLDFGCLGVPGLVLENSDHLSYPNRKIRTGRCIQAWMILNHW